MTSGPRFEAPVDHVQIQEKPDSAAGEAVAGNAGNYAILDEFLRESCMDLMAGYGLPATLQADVGTSQPPTTVAMAAIDFRGRDLRGTISLRMTRSVVLETYRASLGVGVEEDSAEAMDWTCELVNQLVG